ncbi:MAG: recombination mediator RecR [Candidatus Midichloria sp.]|nr:MAG: recombination mediator RecR [Candidatus Midichloria sp.]
MQQNSLQNLISIIAKLPGLGHKSARRIALYLLQNKELMHKLSESIISTAKEMKFCEICSNLDSISPCEICSSNARDKNLICIVEGVSDLWALERSNLYNGLYHVLGGTLSAINGTTPESLTIGKLKKRLSSNISEVIIATNATLEGESTGHYIASLVEEVGLKVTRLAHGIPMGAELDHMDDGTLTIALKLRQLF